MRARNLISLIVLGVGLAAWSRAGAIAAAPGPYYIAAVGDFGPDVITHAAAINNRGDVVGRSTSRLDATAFWPWRQLNEESAPEVLTSGRGEAIAINDERTIAGSSVLPDGRWRAFFYSDDDGLLDVGTLGGSQSVASAINGLGDVAGVSLLPGDGAIRPFRTVGNALVDLGGLVVHAGVGATKATGINNAGQVSGTAVYNPFTYFRHAVRFTPGAGWESLGTLGGTDSEGAAINASGQVCGMAVTGNNPYPRRHAFRYTTGTGMQDLTPNRPGAWATALNDRGDVVGSFIFGNGEWTPGNPYHAFLYTDGAGLTDLNDLIDPSTGWVLQYAYGINNAGEIVGDGELNGEHRAFKLKKDLVAPTITTALSSVDVLWPPDGQTVPVTVTIAATDEFDPAPSCRVAGITTNEPDGRSQFAITGPLSLTLEAARDGQGTGRIYDIVVSCSDRSGNAAQSTIAVRVPHSSPSGVSK